MGIVALFNAIFVTPTINFLLVFLLIFSTWNIPGAFGWSIVSLTVFIRLLLNPLFMKQMKTARDIELLRPKIEALNLKYKNDKKRLQQEQMKLYQTEGINPASGCITGLIQLPVFIGLYQVLQLFLTGGNFEKIVQEVNKFAYSDMLKIATLDPWFLGFNLGVAPSQFQKFGPHYLIIPLITAALQYYQIVLQSPKPAPKPVADKKVKKDDKKSGSEDMSVMMQKQMKIMFPLMIGYFSYILPVGLALYWNIFSLFSIITSNKKFTLWNTQKK